MNVMISDAEKNEFIHKLLVKLDPRQHYFILTYLAVGFHHNYKHKNIVGLLNIPISSHVL